MRVMMFGAGMTLNGANLLLYRWAEHLVGQGHEVLTLPSQHNGISGPLTERYARAGVRIIEAREAYVDNRTLVICNTVFAAEALIEASALTRCIWWIHEAEHGAAILRNNRQGRAFACANAVIFPAPHLIDGAYRGFVYDEPREKVHIVANGVDEAPAASGGRADGPLRIVAVGAIEGRKRQQDLARAVDALPDIPLHCRMIGKIETLDGDLRRRVEAHPDRFELAGELSHEDTLAAIGAADILSLPSLAEALPLATLEAGIRGKPLILSSLPVYRDIWRHGENCLMHAVGDADLLAHLIAILARDEALRDRFGKAAFATARHYRSETMLVQLDQIIERVAG